MVSLEKYLKEYLEYLTFQKRYSHHTVISYENDLNSFLAFTSTTFEVSNILEIESAMVRTWLASLKEKKETSKTLNRKISSLKSFYKYLLTRNIVSVSPMSSISSLKVSRRLPVYLEQNKMESLFDSDQFENSWEGRLHYLILQLFYQTGIRLSELINLQESHFDKPASSIKVLGKGSKERIIPINNSLIGIIDKYLKEKRSEFPQDSGTYLLVNKKGKALYAKYVYNLVNKHLSMVSTISRKSPHVLRHTFATHLTNCGAEINAIKELLGHSSLAATQIYTHNSIEKLKEVYKLAHPKS